MIVTIPRDAPSLGAPPPAHRHKIRNDNLPNDFNLCLQCCLAPLLRGRCISAAPVPAPVPVPAPAPVPGPAAPVPAAPTVLAITQDDFLPAIDECLKEAPAGRCTLCGPRTRCLNN